MMQGRASLTSHRNGQVSAWPGRGARACAAAIPYETDGPVPQSGRPSDRARSATTMKRRPFADMTEVFWLVSFASFAVGLALALTQSVSIPDVSISVNLASGIGSGLMAATWTLGRGWLLLAVSICGELLAARPGTVGPIGRKRPNRI